MPEVQKTEDRLASVRIRFPEDELKFQWLPMLLDAYAIIDSGIAAAIEDTENNRNIKLACKNSCDACCRIHKDIPVYPLELVGIYWFSIEKISGPVRDALRGQLADYGRDGSCPFLINKSCSIHKLRPIACRQFNVFNKPCAENEDPYYTRRDDVLTPIGDYTDQAFYAMLPFYGVTDKTDKAYVIKNKLIHTQVRVLQSLDWKELAKRMDEFSSKD